MYSKLLLNSVTNITGVSFQCSDVTESKSSSLSRGWSKTLIWPRGRGVSRYVTWRCVTLRHASRGWWGRWTLPLPYYLSRVTIVNCNVSDKMCCVTTESMLAAMADCSVTVCCLCSIWNHQLPSRIVASSCGWGTEDTDQKFDGKYWNLINTTPTFVLRHTTQY